MPGWYQPLTRCPRNSCHTRAIRHVAVARWREALVRKPSYLVFHLHTNGRSKRSTLWWVPLLFNGKVFLGGGGVKHAGGRIRPGRGDWWQRFQSPFRTLEPNTGLLGSLIAKLLTQIRPIWVSRTLQGLREPKFLYPEETSNCFAVPAGYSGSCFCTSVLWHWSQG